MTHTINSPVPSATPALAAGTLDPQLRADLLALLLRRYAERLSYGLLHQTRRALGLPARPAAPSEPAWRRLLLHNGDGARPLPESTRPLDLFDSAAGRLLVYGAPGAGTTTLLLELALALTQRAQIDSTARIPVLLDLGGWGEALSLRQWLPLALAERLGASGAFAAELAAGHELTLLLDGLDELPEDQRTRCRDAIQDYLGEVPEAPLVLACGSDTALLLQGGALGSAVELAPLEPGAAVWALARGAASDAWVGRLCDAAQATGATTPLDLHALLLTYDPDTSLDNVPPLESPPTQTSKLNTHNYLAWALRRGGTPRWGAAQSLRSLRWLAQQLGEQGTPLFRLDRLQPTALPLSDLRLGQSLMALLTDCVPGLIIFLYTGEMVMLLLVLLGVLLGHKEIQPGVWWVWSGQAIVRTARHHRSAVVAVSTTLILLCLLAASTPLGMVIALLVAVLTVCVFLIYAGLTTPPLSGRSDPMEGIHAARRTGVWVWAVVASVVLIFTISLRFSVPASAELTPEQVSLLRKDTLAWLGRTVAAGVLMGYIAALRRGLRSFVSFTVLRLLLSRAGLLPWDAVAFLDDLVDRLLLERDGPAYRFRHPLLRDFFAGLTDAQLEALARVR